jgi:hypothetical protein
MRTADPSKPGIGQTCSCEASDILPLRARALLSAAESAYLADDRSPADAPSGDCIGDNAIVLFRNARAVAHYRVRPEGADSRGTRRAVGIAWIQGKRMMIVGWSRGALPSLKALGGGSDR